MAQLAMYTNFREGRQAMTYKTYCCRTHCTAVAPQLMLTRNLMQTDLHFRGCFDQFTAMSCRSDIMQLAAV